jgi:hypothetical protein
MHHFALIPAFTALVLLLPPTALANPFPRQASDFLHRTPTELKRRSPAPAPQSDGPTYEEYIPFPVDKKYLLWSPYGNGPINKAIEAG